MIVVISDELHHSKGHDRSSPNPRLFASCHDLRRIVPRDIVLDTSESATATRTVIVSAPLMLDPAPPLVPDYNASTTLQAAASSTAE